MKISVFAGDVCDVPADALCSSTNPRLSLAMGTGASIRGRGGYQILRACEEIVEGEFHRSGRRGLPAGSVHQTTSGDLPSKVIIHCVASDAAHRSSVDIIRNCVKNALALADASGCKSIAMPLFATGHARFTFDQSILAMAETLRDDPTPVQHVVIVVFDPDRAEDAARLIRSVIPAARIEVQRGPQTTEDPPDMWSGDWSWRSGL
jgi:O-acetyl-ADP-ribose deacetylase